MSTDNRFFHRGAIRRPEHFFGRVNETAQIMGLFRNGQSVSLIGPRRIGKSSLLLHLNRKATRRQFQLESPGALFALVDCQELGDSPSEEVYEVLTAALVSAAGDQFPGLVNIHEEGTYHGLDRLLHAALRDGVSQVVIMLDEFELLASNTHLNPYFFARLRGLTSKHGVAYLTASQRPIVELTDDESILSSPFFNIFVSVSLGLFSDEEARRLVAARLKGSEIAFSDELMSSLLSLVGPHPYFLHVAGYHAFNLAVGVQDLDQPATRERLRQLVESEAEPHLSYMWRNLSLEERYALVTGHGSPDRLQRLEQLCILSSAPGERRYTSELNRRFVQRQQVGGVLQAGPFTIDKRRHEVLAGGALLSLTASQFDLLARLAERPGEVVSGSQLEEAVWGALLDDDVRLKTLIRRLRQAVVPHDDWIVSERGVGYALKRPSPA